MSEISNGDVCVLVAGGGMAGLATALALLAAGCEVHVYEESPDGFSPSSEVGVPLTEELQSFCKQHGVDLVSVQLAAASSAPASGLCLGLPSMLMPLLPHLFLAVQDKRVTRSTGRTVLADDGECVVQDDKQQDFVSWDSLKRCAKEAVGLGFM